MIRGPKEGSEYGIEENVADSESPESDSKKEKEESESYITGRQVHWLTKLAVEQTESHHETKNLVRVEI